MKPHPPGKNPFLPGGALLAACLLLLWLGSLLVAIVPELHRWVHCAQDSSPSPCVFARLAHGILMPPHPVAVELAMPTEFGWHTLPPLRETRISAYCGHWLPFGCGPPKRLCPPVL